MAMKNLSINLSNLRAIVQSEHNALAQYSYWNNVIPSGIPDPVSNDTLKESVISVFADFDV